MRAYKIVWALVASTFIATAKAAVPAVGGSSGTVTEGSKVTVTGSAFLDGAQAPKRLFWDTTDTNTSYAGIADGAAVPVGAGKLWGSNGNPYSNKVTISKTTARNARRNATYSLLMKGFLTSPGTVKSQNLNRIYVSWFVNPSVPITKGGSNKFARIWDDDNGKFTRVSWTQEHTTYNSSVADKSNWADWGGVAGKWNRLEAYLDGGAGKIQEWTNGKLVHNISDFLRAAGAPYGLYPFQIGFDSSVPEYYPDIVVRFSDIYISDSQARVELSNQATWADAAADREVQPFDAWEDGKIVFTVNMGSLDETAPLFLYVVNPAGGVNASGYPVGVSPPQAPTLQVN